MFSDTFRQIFSNLTPKTGLDARRSVYSLFPIPALIPDP
jgi:hypothetical protein